MAQLTVCVTFESIQVFFFQGLRKVLFVTWPNWEKRQVRYPVLILRIHPLDAIVRCGKTSFAEGKK